MKTPLNILHFFYLKESFRTRKELFFLFALFICSSGVQAAIETSTNRISSSGVVTNASITAIDNKYAFIQANPTTWDNTFKIASGVGRVRVGFNHSSLAYVSAAYDYTFYLKIQYQDSSLAAATTIYRELSAQYDPSAAASYQDAALYEVNHVGVVWIKASIDSIRNNLTTLIVASVPLNMFLEASTVVERYYVMNYTAVLSTSGLSYIAPQVTNYTDSNEVEIYWHHIDGAEQYQLEWTYINDYNISGSTQSTDSLAYDFTHNSTRITTPQHFFNIPLIFDKGWLLFRVRAVGKAYDSATGEWKFVYSRWSSDASSGSADTVTNYTSGHRYHITTPHEINKNWQYAGTFAEEGKKKEVVSYYDGSLRNRQTVTKTSTDKKVLVGETFYDFQGRAAVTALPAPVPGEDEEIEYYAGFNLVDSAAVNKGYSRFDFDVDDDPCVAPALGMKTSSGASNYYSAFNAEINYQQAFLPDAKKFPFAQVEYMPDNTGRIRQQGGVGPDHQLASDHQTKYFYAQPFQEELDRLFGTDAGYKKHYNKTVTIDANGQASVTYLDQEGRTIATALAGVNPYNLLPLTDASGDTLYKTSATSFTVDLLGKDTVSATDTDHDDNILSTDGRTLSVNTQLAVPFAQEYSFAYSLVGSKYTPGCLPEGICYQCVYDMTIEVRDQCGVAMGGTPVTQKVGSFSADCDDDTATFTLTPGSLDITLPIGSYTVTKTLTINDSALEAYWDDYLAQTTCTRTLQSFIDSAEAHMDSTGCHMDIEDDLGYVSDCEISYMMMLSDVSPHGQYAQYYVNGSPAPYQYPLSVLNDASIYLPSGSSANWRNPIINGSPSNYYNEDGTTVSHVPLIQLTSSTYSPPVEVGATITMVNGIPTVEPQELANVEDFVANWKPSWATSLVEYHPEYCYFKWCEDDMTGQGSGADTLSSDEYDSLLLSTDSYTAAVAAGYIDPLGNGNASPNQTNCKDPFFRALGSGHYQYNHASLPDACEYASDFQGTGVSIWEMAAVVNICGTVYGNATDVTNCLTAHFTTLPTDQRDYVYNDSTWHTFRALYISIKQHFQHQQADSSARACGGYNGCIGNDHYDPHASGMFVGTPFTNWPYFTDPSPCGHYFMLYSGKIQRFPNAEDLVVNMSNAWSGNPGTVLDSMQSEGDYNFYLQTGQCPMAFQLQEFLNALNANGDLKGTNIDLQAYPQFTPGLYDEVTGHPGSFAGVEWTGSGSGATLTGAFAGSGFSCTSMTLSFPGGSSFSWSGLPGTFTILNFSQLTSTGSGSFTVVATIDHDNNAATAPVTEVLTGSSGCIDVTCSFPDKCEPNVLATELYTLLNIVAANGDLYNTGSMTVELTAGTYGSYFNGTQIHATLGAGSFYWNKISAGHFLIWDGVGAYNALHIYIPAIPASGVTSFNTMQIISPDTLMEMNAYDGSDNAVTMYVDYYIGFTPTKLTSEHLGTCGPSTPLSCQGEDYQRRDDLEAFLNQLAVDGELADGGTTDLYTYPYFTPLLAATFGPTSYNCHDSIIGDSLIVIFENDTTGDTTCTVLLEFTTAPGGGNTWADVNKIKDIVADEMNMTNGVAYSFTATAWFTDNSSMSITGTSCWGIRNCSVCLANAGNKYQNFDSFDSGSPGFTSTLTYTVTCPATNYYTVTKNASTLCSDATMTGQDHTQPGTGKYYFTHYNSNGAKTLWSTTTTVTAFTAYNFSAWYMNNWLDSAQHNVTLELWANSVLVASTLVADTAPGVWQKLQGVWNGTNSAGSITIEVKTSGGGTVDTRLGIDDIGFYTQGCGPKVVLTLDTLAYFPYCDSCGQQALDIAAANGQAQYTQYIDSVQADFKARYIAHCMSTAVEVFTVTDTIAEYHYTLYYYDQAGNLTRTIPPAGVTPLNLTTYGQTIRNERALRTVTPTSPKSLFTTHTLATTYTYNTLNQLVQQVTPDGDTTRFWYDKLGRIVASQNAKQKIFSTPRYSYTVYDEQGRISEVGELATSNNLRTASFATQQTWLNDDNYPDLLDGAVVSGGNLRYQVTKTFYDEIKFSSAAARFSDATQENLRKRVASAAIYEYYNGTDGDYDHATHYSYDLHGNVDELVQETPELNDLNDPGDGIYQTFKNMIYTYDLVSGKVNELQYNPGFADQYFYKYEYDADNRVTAAYTSTDHRQWDRDAKYFYYKHGPLARTEIAQDKVQGMDYAYTLHGWIKGVNSNKLDAAVDMGKDADATFTVNLNRYIAADQFGYSLTYYDSIGKTDYTSIGGSSWLADQSASSLRSGAGNLWNGNIKNMVTSILPFMTANGRPQGRVFAYDQLNRIRTATADTNFVVASNNWGASGGTTKWKETFKYDQNGNITKLIRHGNVLTPMDSMDYHYNANTNQLNYVDDISSSYSDDIDDQSSNNYKYDKIGNLVFDAAEEIDTIKWNVYGKIEKVIRSTTSSKSDLEFHYDAMGNRVCKIVKPRAGSGILGQENWTYTYYLRDASGNVISTYDRAFRIISGSSAGETFTQKETDLYGSSRVGIRNTDLDIATVTLTYSGYNSDKSLNVTAVSAGSGTTVSDTTFVHRLGEKMYELVNHLGNVLVTVSDMRTANNSGSAVIGFNAVVESATDYFAFGAPMAGRTFSSPSYRYGFNGKEKQDELHGNSGDAYDFDVRIYDARLGCFLSVDPKARKYASWSPYQFAHDNPIKYPDNGYEPIGGGGAAGASLAGNTKPDAIKGVITARTASTKPKATGTASASSLVTASPTPAPTGATGPTGAANLNGQPVTASSPQTASPGGPAGPTGLTGPNTQVSGPVGPNGPTGPSGPSTRWNQWLYDADAFCNGNSFNGQGGYKLVTNGDGAKGESPVNNGDPEGEFNVGVAVDILNSGYGPDGYSDFADKVNQFVVDWNALHPATGPTVAKPQIIPVKDSMLAVIYDGYKNHEYIGLYWVQKNCGAVMRPATKDDSLKYFLR